MSLYQRHHDPLVTQDEQTEVVHTEPFHCAIFEAND